MGTDGRYRIDKIPTVSQYNGDTPAPENVRRKEEREREREKRRSKGGELLEKNHHKKP